MSFQDDESSAENNRPLEFYTITFPDETYTHCSGTRDTLIDGTLYTAIPIARTNIGVSATRNSKELTLTLPITHAAVSKFINGAVPPKKVEVTVSRYQRNSGEWEQIWYGVITSMSTEGRVAKFLVPSRAARLFLRVIPNVTVGKLCPHVLYDEMCGVSRSSFIVNTTVIHVSGRTVRYDQGDTTSDGWAINGELIHNPTGMRMAIGTHKYVGLPSSVVEIEMQMRIPGMQVGDSITVHAGCDHTLEQCIERFNNRQNFGGFPQLPSKNPFIPTGYGIREQ